jgi:8-oxo-dGTP diphosphatase
MLVVAGVIRKDGKLLIAQRKYGCPREPGKWEFPGGKVERGETPQQSLEREIMEELGVRITVGARFCQTSVESNGVRIRLVAYLAGWAGGEPRALDCEDFRWVAPGELSRYDWADADEPIARRLLRRRSGFGMARDASRSKGPWVHP